MKQYYKIISSKIKNIKHIHIVGKIVLYFFLFEVAFIFLYPFIYLLANSFKSFTDLYDSSVIWIATKVQWQNYRYAFTHLDYFRSLVNSMILSSVSTIGHLLACSFIAYGFSRYDFPGKNAMFIIVILSIIIPMQAVFLPTFVIFGGVLNWRNTYLPIWVPTLLGYGLRGGMFIFIFRQFFLSIPKAIEEAAWIDGCGVFRCFYAIIMPMCRSAILVVAILSFFWHWNEYYEARLYISDQTKMILAQKINSMNALAGGLMTGQGQGYGAVDVELDVNMFNNAVTSACVLLVLIPVLFVYFFAQKNFIEGIQSTGIKG